MATRKKRGGPSLNCLICFDNISQSRRRIQLPHQLGQEPGQVFRKVCDVLDVPFLEVYQDWNLERSDIVPFCSLCGELFQSVIQLQQQLTEIQKLIEDKISEIREKIRSSDPVAVQYGNPKAISFRVKAGRRPPEESKSFLQSSVKPKSRRTACTKPVETSVTNVPPPQHLDHDLFSSWLAGGSLTSTSHYNPPALQPEPVPVQKEDNYEDESNFDNNLDDGHNSFSSDSESAEPAPPPPQPRRTQPQTASNSSPVITRHVPVSEAFPFLPPAPPRANPYSKLSRPSETFSPVITSPSGEISYEGIQIIPIPSGYQCGQCLATIGKDHSSIALRKAKIHMKGFHLGGYKCDLCQKSFTSNDILLQHLNRFHIPRPSVICLICGRDTKYSAIKSHQFTHMNAEEKALALASGFKPKPLRPNKFPCKICGRLCRGRSHLKSHELTHVDAKFRRDFHCEQCPKSFTQRIALDDHIDACHNALTLRKKLCTVCGESIPVKKFYAHSKTHQVSNCKHCRKPVQACNLEAHEQKCAEKGKQIKNRLECEICKTLFNSLLYLRNHQRAKHREEYNALKEQKKTKVVATVEETLLPILELGSLRKISESKFEVFKYKVDKLETGWKCECGEVIDGGEEEITVHVKDSHVGAFKCLKCGKFFKSLADSEVHDQQDHGLAYPCQICGANLTKRTIAKHIWSHRSVAEAVQAVNEGERIPRDSSEVGCRQMKVFHELGIVLDVQIRCQICDETGFKSVYELFIHRGRAHPDAKSVRVKRLAEENVRGRKRIYPEGTQCYICDQQFAKRCYYLAHIRNVHKKRLTKRIKRKEKLEESDKEDNSLSAEPVNIKDEPISDEEEEQEEQEEISTITQIHGNRYQVLKCQVEKTATGWKCECGEVTTRREDKIIAHVERCHVGDFDSCRICGRKFKMKKNYLEHMHKYHGGHKPVNSNESSPHNLDFGEISSGEKVKAVLERFEEPFIKERISSGEEEGSSGEFLPGDSSEQEKADEERHQSRRPTGRRSFKTINYAESDSDD